MTLVDGGAAARARAESHFVTCGPRTVLDPDCEAHALATDVIALQELAQSRLNANHVLTDRLAVFREAQQRVYESLSHYVESRTEESPCGDCGGWGEHDSDSCEFVALVNILLDAGAREEGYNTDARLH
jgi:hypothetical protein